MSADVRLDRMARPQWFALPPETRAEIEAAIPEGCFLTILSKWWNGRDYHARVFRGTHCIGESGPTRYVDDAAVLAIAQALLRPMEATYERDGYVVEPFVNEGEK